MRLATKFARALMTSSSARPSQGPNCKLFARSGDSRNTGLTSGKCMVQAAKIVLLRPGDAYFFSGGTAHTALCVDGMGLSSYESIVTLHPLHSGLCMQTCDTSSPCWLEGAMPDDEFEDILEEAAEQLDAAAQQLLEERSIFDALLLPALLAALLPAPLQADLKTLDWARCGVKGHAKRRIVNGKDAEECVWRWQVSINSNSYGQFCGGTLIGESWVLTAAHCVASVKSHCARCLRMRNVKHDYDFALLKLDKAVPLNRCIGTACLPSENRCGEVETGCSITGWGTLNSQGRTPEVLQEAPVKVFPTEACEKNYSKTKDHTKRSDGLQPNSDGLQPNGDGL
eukprot:g3366.t1